jgi:hypothetical protein
LEVATSVTSAKTWNSPTQWKRSSRAPTILSNAYDSFQVDQYDLRADSAWDLASKTGKRNFFTLQTLRLIAKWRPDPFRFMQKCKKIGLKALIFVDVLRLDFHPIAGT